MLLAVAQPLEHALRWPGVEQRLARRHLADRVDEVVAADLLEDVAGGAGHDRVEQGLVVGERRQHQALHLGMRRADLAAHLDAAAVGQAHVEHGDVGPCGGDAVAAPRRSCRPRRRPRCRRSSPSSSGSPRRTTSWSSSRNTRMGPSWGVAVMGVIVHHGAVPDGHAESVTAGGPAVQDGLGGVAWATEHSVRRCNC